MKCNWIAIKSWKTLAFLRFQYTFWQFCAIKMSKQIFFSYHHNMKKTNIKSRIEIINAGFYASYINSDKIRFSSTYKNISSVEQLYFSISRNASLKITSIMKKICKWITAFLNDFYVWNTACKTAFYKIPSPFIVILSQKNALFRNRLLLRVHYISILNSQCPFVYPTRQNFASVY